VVPHLPKESIPLTIYSEHHTNKNMNKLWQTFRSTPKYRGEEAWTDWVYADLYDDGATVEATRDTLAEYSSVERKLTTTRIPRFTNFQMDRLRPTRIFGFFSLPPLDKDIDLPDGSFIRTSPHAPTDMFIGLPLKLNPIHAGGLQHNASTIQYWSRHSSSHVIIPCEDICYPCIVVPDLDFRKKENPQLQPTGNWTVVGPPFGWSQSFLTLTEDYDEADELDRVDRFIESSK
jgi:hypothetical protein